ncbi:MAG: hypothetical protein ACHQHL_13770 [Steroidobacterales bacterium]|jgi:hypothetical protein
MSNETADGGFVSEIHRYFPEWADRPVGPDTQQEADRNSYLAGGYADEFGYGAHAGGPPAIDPLTGDPENSRLWREQVGALHPGYPQCPKPLDRYGLEPPPAVFVPRRSREAPRDVVGFRVIQIGPPGRKARKQASLRQLVLRLGLLSFMAERLIRRRHLNDVH